jgi:hypothetical protein
MARNHSNNTSSGRCTDQVSPLLDSNRSVASPGSYRLMFSPAGSNRCTPSAKRTASTMLNRATHRNVP